MAAAKYNLLIEQGSTFNRVITYKDSDGNAVNLAGYRVRLQARPRHDSSAVLLELDSAGLDPGMTMGPLDATGTIDFTLSDEVTAALDFRSAVYDLTIESAAGVITRLVEGTVTVSPGVTR